MIGNKNSTLSRQTANDWQIAINSVSDLIFILDLDQKILAANTSTLKITGLTEKELIGRHCYEIFHQSDKPPCQCPHENLQDNPAPHTINKRLEFKNRVYKVSCSPVFDDQGKILRIIHVAKDITSQDKAAISLKNFNRALKTMGECNKLLARPNTEQELLQKICRAIVEKSGYKLAWVGFTLHDPEKSVHPTAYFGYENNYLKSINIAWSDTEKGQGPTGTAIRTGRPVACRNIVNDPSFAPWRDNAIQRGYASSLSLPLAVDGNNIGALNIYAETADAFDEQEVQLLFSMASDLSYGISSRRLKEDQRQKEIKLAQKSSEWANAMDFIEDSVYLIDMDDKIIMANKAFLKMTGLSAEEIIGRDICTIMHPQGEIEPCRVCTARSKRQDAFIYMDKEDSDNPSGRPIQVMVKMIRNPDGFPVRVLMGVRDMSAIEELRRQAQIINQINEAVVATDQNGLIRNWNKGAENLLGYSEQEAVGRNINDILIETCEARDHKKLFPEDSSSRETSIKTLTGTSFYAFISTSDIINDSGKKAGSIYSIRDITDLKTATEHKENQARMWALGSDIGHAIAGETTLHRLIHTFCQAIVNRLGATFARIWLYDSAENILVLHGSAGKYTHLDGPHGRIHVDDNSKIGMLALHKKAILTNEVIGDPRIKDQQWAKREKMVAFAGHPLIIGERFIGVVALFAQKPLPEFILKVFESIADKIAMGIDRHLAEKERETLQKQVRQMQKMEAIGTLAGGIAHDFNNILTAILGFGDLLKYEVKENDPAQESLQQIIKAGNRAKDLVRQILTFSRQREQQRQPLHAHLIVKEAIKLLKASIPSTITIKENIATELDSIMADPTEIHQIVMNLCTNAYHAMQEQGGLLEIILERVELDQYEAARDPRLQPGKYLRLTVKDSGHGMNSSTMERIFEPYFTTKDIGQGTGMGLSVVHGIVESLRGAIIIDSEINKGTSFFVYLPALDRMQTDFTHEIEESLPGGREKILLVDDEEDILEYGRRALKILGYEVTTRSNGIEALHLFQHDPERFDLIITDQMMPHMTGMELSKKIIAIRTNFPVILITGYSFTLSAEKAKAMGIREFVMKPLLTSELAKVVRKVLDKPK